MRSLAAATSASTGGSLFRRSSSTPVRPAAMGFPLSMLASISEAARSTSHARSLLNSGSCMSCLAMSSVCSRTARAMAARPKTSSCPFAWASVIFSSATARTFPDLVPVGRMLLIRSHTFRPRGGAVPWFRVATVRDACLWLASFDLCSDMRPPAPGFRGAPLRWRLIVSAAAVCIVAPTIHVASLTRIGANRTWSVRAEGRRRRRRCSITPCCDR